MTIWSLNLTIYGVELFVFDKTWIQSSMIAPLTWINNNNIIVKVSKYPLVKISITNSMSKISSY